MGDTVNINEQFEGTSGLQQLRLMLDAGMSPPMCEALKFRLIEVEEGRAVFVGQPGPHVYNPIGSVHGGYAATLLDSALGCAVHSRLSANQVHTTLELKIAYHRGMTAETGEVRAEGTVLSMGRRVAFAEGRLIDTKGRLLASATSTLLVIERPQPH